jgi:hypothetical protein
MLRAIYFSKSVENYHSSAYQREMIHALSDKINLYLYGPGYPGYSPKDSIQDVISKSDFSPDCLIVGHRWLSDTPGEPVARFEGLKFNEANLPLFGFLNKEYVNLEQKLAFFCSNEFLKVFSHHHCATSFNRDWVERFVFVPFAFCDKKMRRKKVEIDRPVDFMFSGVLKNPWYESSSTRLRVQSQVFASILGVPVRKKRPYRSRNIFWNAIQSDQILCERKFSLHRVIRKVWPKYSHRHLSDQEFGTKLGSSKIVLNSPSPAGLIGPRYYESMAAGAAVLTEQAQQLQRLFPNSSYVSFSFETSEKDFSEKLDWLLSNDTDRVQIARLAQDTVFKEHTWDARARLILNEIMDVL